MKLAGKNKSGFTLIELLVVIAIIGLLATMSVVSLNNARLKARDAKRVSDIKQLQTALELYFADNNQYPNGTIDLNAQDGILGDANHATLSQNHGFNAAVLGTTYMGQVPSDPGVESWSATAYTYTGAVDSYLIEFGLAGVTGGLSCAAPAADCCNATPEGIGCS